MKTAGIGNQNRYATERSEPSLWNGSREHLLLNYTGWKTTKTPVAGEVFFLTFPFIELTKHKRQLWYGWPDEFTPSTNIWILKYGSVWAFWRFV